MLVSTVLISYFVVGTLLTRRAMRHLKQPDERHYYSRINDPSAFTAEGNRLRIIAKAFWLLGGIVAGIVFLRH